MPQAIRMLMNRGYWDAAGDGTEGGAGGGTGEGGSGEGTGAGEGTGSGEGGSGSGESKISDSEAKLLKEVMQKKKALAEATDNIKKLNEKLAQFDGIDPVAVRELLNQKKTEETKQLEAKGEWDRLRAQIVEEHNKEKLTLSERVSAAEKALQDSQRVISELTVGNAFAQSQFIREELALTPSKTRVVYGAHFDYVDGQVVAYDKPAGSPNRTQLIDAKGDPLSFEAALKKIVDADPDRDQLLRSKMKQGAGSNTDVKAGKPDNMADKPVVKGISRISAALAKASTK